MKLYDKISYTIFPLIASIGSGMFGSTGLSVTAGASVFDAGL